MIKTGGGGLLPLKQNLLTLFLACSMDLALWECLHEMRGVENDLISLQLRKTEAISPTSHLIPYKSFAIM